MLKLERPSFELFPSFLDFMEEMKSNGETLWAPYMPQENESPEAFVHRLLQRSENPESSMVPETVYWAVLDNIVVGRISLRHRLAGNLHKIGGHIGYEVRPSFRKRGLATEMLRLVLNTPQAKEIKRLLLTCSPNNIASNKTIISNGGQLTQTVYVDFIGEDRHHYWITLET